MRRMAIVCVLLISCGGSVNAEDRDESRSITGLYEPHGSGIVQDAGTEIVDMCQLAQANGRHHTGITCERDEIADMYCLDPCPHSAVTCMIDDATAVLSLGPPGGYYVAHIANGEHTFCIEGQ